MNNPNGIGYTGNKSYNLKYFTKTRNLRCLWPHNNLFNNAKDENILFQSILHQNVGLQQREIFKNENLQDLKHYLKCLLRSHQKTRYGEILKKCMRQVRDHTNTRDS